MEAMIPVKKLKKDTGADDRVRCDQCRNLSTYGKCTSSVVGGYRPHPTMMRRCEDFNPKPDEQDQRKGAERWPQLLENISKVRMMIVQTIPTKKVKSEQLVNN